MSYVSYADQADEYRREAGRCYYRARRDAQRSEKEYKSAAYYRRHAAWLTTRPDLWDEDNDPASYEGLARSLTGYADTLLSGSFRETDSARLYTDLARRYDALAERR